MIWFDLDNSPHVPLFVPVFDELKMKEKSFFVTARDFAQTKDLLELFQVKYSLLGKHGGKNRINKIINLVIRSSQLYSFIRNNYNYKKIGLAVSHGSRSQLVTAKGLNIRSLLMFDYEYTESFIFNYLSNFMLAPEILPIKYLKKIGFNVKKLIRYGGLKEELYLPKFKPDPKFREKIGVSKNSILVVIRPPGMQSNYHDSRSENILIEIIKYLLKIESVIVVIVSRTQIEKNFIRNKIGINERLKFLDKVVEGLQLLYAADLTISGGGTMNRESALLGTKTYSIFTGKRPFIDIYLNEIGRLEFIDSIKDVEKIEIKRDLREKKMFLHSKNLASEVSNIILDLSES